MSTTTLPCTSTVPYPFLLYFQYAICWTQLLPEIKCLHSHYWVDIDDQVRLVCIVNMIQYVFSLDLNNCFIFMRMNNLIRGFTDLLKNNSTRNVKVYSLNYSFRSSHLIFPLQANGYDWWHIEVRYTVITTIHDIVCSHFYELQLIIGVNIPQGTRIVSVNLLSTERIKIIPSVLHVGMVTVTRCLVTVIVFVCF